MTATITEPDSRVVVELDLPEPCEMGVECSRCRRVHPCRRTADVELLIACPTCGTDGRVATCAGHYLLVLAVPDLVKCQHCRTRVDIVAALPIGGAR